MKDIIKEAFQKMPKFSQAGAVLDVTEQVIKEEAIKWVKANVEKDGFTHWRDFMNFHNITEEDLK